MTKTPPQTSAHQQQGYTTRDNGGMRAIYTQGLMTKKMQL